MVKQDVRRHGLFVCPVIFQASSIDIVMDHAIVCICRLWVGIKKLLLLVDAAKQVTVFSFSVTVLM